jgi:hypothetical protein
VYLKYLDQAGERISRIPRASPTSTLTRRPDNTDGYKIAYFAIGGYDPHAAIAIFSARIKARNYF